MSTAKPKRITWRCGFLMCGPLYGGSACGGATASVVLAGLAGVFALLLALNDVDDQAHELLGS